MPDNFVSPVAPRKSELDQTPAVPSKLEPIPKSNITARPIPLVVSQVPVVSPGIVIVLYSKVSAELIVKLKG